jgi:tetratricopeptide (TPR) repeat protein
MIDVLRGGRWSAALHLQRALTIHEQAGDLADTADSLTGLGFVSEISGDWVQAEALYRRAMAVADRMDPSLEQATPRQHLARIRFRQGDTAAASILLDEALSLTEAKRPTTEYQRALNVVAELQVRQGDQAGAMVTLERALAEGGPADLLVGVRCALADLHIARGNHDLARQHANAAKAIAARAGVVRLDGRVHLTLARLAVAEGNLDLAISEHESAARLLEEADASYLLAVATRDLGRLLQRSERDPIRGRALLDAARTRFQQLGADQDAEVCGE